MFRDLIDSVLNNNPIEIKTQLGNIMESLISEHLEDIKIAIAEELFSERDTSFINASIRKGRVTKLRIGNINLTGKHRKKAPKNYKKIDGKIQRISALEKARKQGGIFKRKVKHSIKSALPFSPPRLKKTLKIKI